GWRRSRQSSGGRSSPRPRRNSARPSTVTRRGRSTAYYIPYAVLGALIFPDILTASGSIYSSAAGAVTALILGWYGRGILAVLTGGILATYLTRLFCGM
ncbi:MAG: AzlD domain-containing protein, partial [Synergistaceae bacterium]|nr:AzlD domain-containing protein [Synergistaceae bacterium]